MITEEQKQFKKGKLGASQCAAALGISPWQTPAALYHEIIGNLEPEDMGEKGLIGNWIEPTIIKAYEHRTGITVHKFLDTLIHPDHPWMICHLDGEMPAYEMTIEIKNVGWTVAHHWAIDGDPDGVPQYVMAQCVQQAILADVERVDVAAFFGGNELRVYPLEITTEAKQAVLDGLTSFWDNYIIPRKQPEITEKDLELMKKLYFNPVEHSVIEVESTKTALMFQDYRMVKVDIKVMQKKADLYKAKIQEFMGDHSIIMRGEDQEFTWKKTSDHKEIDWQSVAGGMLESHEELFPGEGKAEFDGLVEEYTKTIKGHRVFLDKEK